MSERFKICPCCKKIWHTQEQFISDAELELIGYKADFEKLEFGLFFFNHTSENCKSTLTIETMNFLNLFTGPRVQMRKNDTAECPGYCNNQNQLSRCNMLCECAYVREIIEIIKKLSLAAKGKW